MRLIDADALLEAIDIKIIFKTGEPINDAHKLINDSVVDEVKKATEQYRQCIRNIITNAPTVQREGWVSVPIEPTEEMKIAGYESIETSKLSKMSMKWQAMCAYKAMIQAAPTDTE